MGWLTLVSTALKIINTIVQWANRQSMISMGAKQEIARQTVAVLRSSGVTKDLIAEIVLLSDEEIRERLEDDDFIQ